MTWTRPAVVCPARIGGVALACFLAFTAGAADARADSVLLRPARDSTLIEDPAGALANGSGPAVFSGRINSTSRSIRRALLAFDIAAAIPPGSTVTGARLTLELSATSAGPESMRLHTILADWGEGASSSSGGGGAPAVPGDSTWIHRFYPDVFWSQAGGDFDPIARGETIVDQPGPYSWGPTPEMVTDVQSWLDHPEAAFGWILIGEESNPQTVKRFESRETEDETSRPLLEVEFAPPCSPDPAGPGYWRGQCEALAGTGSAGGRCSSTPADVDPRFADQIVPCAIRVLAGLGLSGLDACGALLTPPPPTCDDRAAARLSVLVLNVCAGRLQTSCPVDAAGDGCVSTNVADLLIEISDLIRAGDCRQAAACAAASD
jgi:hypothetical protein